jgi:predicted nucleotidyltransferase/DNA-binding transcriptional regulator YhcF (GntR family)
MLFNKPVLEVINTKTKQKIIGFLLRYEALMSEREISAVLGVSHMSVNRIMRELAEMNFVQILRTGKVYLWKVNRKSYLFNALARVYQITSDGRGPLEDLKKTILKNLPLSGVAKVILFGSIGRKTERFNSDVDLYIQVKDQQVEHKLRQAIEKLGLVCMERYGNVLSPYILSEGELKEKRGLKLISNIKKGIVLYTPNRLHES